MIKAMVFCAASLFVFSSPLQAEEKKVPMEIHFAQFTATPYGNAPKWKIEELKRQSCFDRFLGFLVQALPGNPFRPTIKSRPNTKAKAFKSSPLTKTKTSQTLNTS